MIFGKAAFIFLSVFLPLTSCSDDANPLTAVTEQQGRQITQLEGLVQEQATKMAAMETLIQQQASTISDLQTSVQTLTGQMALQTPFVAFDVYYKADYATVADHDIMKFDNIALNIGNGYNPQNGMFQAPVSGVYLFHVKVTPTDLGEVYLYLMKEGQAVDSIYARDDNFQQTGDSARIFQLTKGQRVWLVKHHGQNRIHGWVWTKMAAVLLRATA